MQKRLKKLDVLLHRFALRVGATKLYTDLKWADQGTKCFVSVMFAFIFTYVHFLTSVLLYSLHRGNKTALATISTQFILYLY